MSVKNLPADLLAQARQLSRWEPKRPKQASLRRAVSTAYYAVFHLLTADAARLTLSNAEDDTKHSMQRWFDHRDMKNACIEFCKSPTEQPLKKFRGAETTVDLRLVAKTFILLQEARHKADYDMNSSFTRSEASSLVQQAEACFGRWQFVRKTAEANVFALSLFAWKTLAEKSKH